MSDKTFKIVNGDMSDGYHTFDELYEHRCLLFLNLCLKDPLNCYWRPDFTGWFVVYWETPWGQISYHLPDKLLKYVSESIDRDDAHVFDGHNGEIVLDRLLRNAMRAPKRDAKQ